MDAQVVTYQEQYKSVFRDLNLEWIRKYFAVEVKDVEQTSAPEQCLREGGEIFFVVVDGDAVGTCAMYKIGDGVFELAKMAVSPLFHGKGFGDLLMQAAENWARERCAREIHILSNTVLEPAIGLYKKHGYETIHLGAHPDYERCNIEMRKVL
ncbi:MAG: GNAT family N-acetyltransferase [Bdellovibrionales bacterium]|nr:GNAT family N-acetyltransferase [Bdellovibrionales bacterium]